MKDIFLGVDFELQVMIHDKNIWSVPTEMLLESKMKNVLNKPEQLTSRSVLKQHDEVFRKRSRFRSCSSSVFVL